MVCPPSAHVSGRSYAWEAGCAPGKVPLADLPWWIQTLSQDADPPSPKAGPSAHEVPTRTEGERADFAGHWAQVGITFRPGDHSYLCPFHNDHRPSLHIDAEGCRFYCFGCGRGGGIGRLRRLLANPRAPEPMQERASVHPAPPEPKAPTTLAGSNEVRVVGESSYQDTLLDLTGGRRHYGGVHMERIAHLVPEPDNPADPMAIAVNIGGRTVGHLSHFDAEHYAAAITAAIERSGEASCSAVIVGGWEREHGNVGLFGVRLCLSASSNTMSS